MAELYDVIAGSETGALIAGSLVIPADKDSSENYINKYWGSDSIKHFKENSLKLYSSQNLEWYWSFLIIIINMIAIVILAWYCSGKKLNPKRKQAEILLDL